MPAFSLKVSWRENSSDLLYCLYRKFPLHQGYTALFLRNTRFAHGQRKEDSSWLCKIYHWGMESKTNTAWSREDMPSIVWPLFFGEQRPGFNLVKHTHTHTQSSLLFVMLRLGLAVGITFSLTIYSFFFSLFWMNVEWLKFSYPLKAQHMCTPLFS